MRHHLEEWRLADHLGNLQTWVFHANVAGHSADGETGSVSFLVLRIRRRQVYCWFIEGTCGQGCSAPTSEGEYDSEAQFTKINSMALYCHFWKTSKTKFFITFLSKKQISTPRLQLWLSLRPCQV